MLRQSSRFDYRLIGTNASAAPLARGFLDTFYMVPLGDDSAYAEALLEVVRKERPDVILPWSDDEADVMSKLKEELAALGCRALVSSPDCLARVANKRITYDYLSAAGVAVPEYTSVTDVTGLRKAISNYRHPERTVVVKPVRGRGGRGLRILLGEDSPPDWLGSGQREERYNNRDLNHSIYAEFFGFGEELLVMPCLGEPAFDADLIVLGQNPVVLVRRRHNPTGIPFQGNTLVADPQLLDYCRTVARVLELEAIHDIDLMTGTDGRPVLLEVNPRPSGSLPASMAGGFPLIDWAVERVLGGNPETSEPRHDVDVLPRVVPHVIGRG
jgi:carbamoylphosphate synthase large subunit